VKILNSEKKKARDGQPLNSHSAMQQQYQSQDLLNTNLHTSQSNVSGNMQPEQQKQRFKDSSANSNNRNKVQLQSK